MNEARFRELMDQFAMELMAEDLEHSPWVVVVWSKGQGEGPPEVAHGPYQTAFEALTKAEQLHQEMENAPGRHTFMAGYTPTIHVIPVYADDE